FIKFLFSKVFFKQVLYLICLTIFLIFISVISLSYFTMHGESVEVPNLVGKTLDQVDVELKSLDLSFVVLDSARYNSSFKPLSVIDHQPISGSKVKINRKIYLTINPNGFNEIAIPRIIRTTIRQATQRLESSGFVIGEIEYVDDIGKDEIIEISHNGEMINEGDKLLRNSVIDLILGNGKL
ncbi:PASTA domain-containing protein, partial [Flavobacteriaceae bacterium]|nr:PASTA domain-containing protein [Flavobacteriaceae bacterium]